MRNYRKVELAYHGLTLRMFQLFNRKHPRARYAASARCLTAAWITPEEKQHRTTTASDRAYF